MTPSNEAANEGQGVAPNAFRQNSSQMTKMLQYYTTRTTQDFAISKRFFQICNCNFVRHFPVSACIHPRLPLAGLSHPVHQFRVSSESSQSNREIDMFLEIYGNLMFQPTRPLQPWHSLTTTHFFPTKKCIFMGKKKKGHLHGAPKWVTRSTKSGLKKGT